MIYELYIFADHAQAVAAGFRGASLRHPEKPNAVVWIPDWGADCLRGRRYSAVHKATGLLEHPRFNKPEARRELERGLDYAMTAVRP